MQASRQALAQGQRQLTRRSSAIRLARAYTTSPASSSSSTSTSQTTSATSSKPAYAAKPSPIKFNPTASKWQKGAAASTTAAPASGKAAEPTPMPDDLIYKPKTDTHWTAAVAAAAAAPEDVAGGASETPGLVDWRTSFHGISACPVTEEQYASLTQPLDERDIEVKPDGVIYLPEIKYRRRLNEAFGPMGWGIIPRGDAVVGDSIVTREYALIVNGRFASQAQGENTYFSADQLPSAVEGCKSNALMRCCKDLGIASELWDPTFVRWFKKNRMEEVWVEHATTKKKRTLWYRKGAVEVAYPYRLSGTKQG